MRRDARLRLFCALQLPDDALDDLAAWQRHNLHGGRPVPRENLHVTVAFLGARPAGDAGPVGAELRAAAADAEPFTLQPLRYRETRSVGMIVLDDPSGAAAALADDLRRRLARAGLLRLDGRRWLPHVTVVRHRGPAGVVADVANMRSIDVVRSALYRSVLGPDGARYDALETAPLGGR